MTLTTNHHHHHQIVLRSPTPPPLALTRRQPLLTGTLTPSPTTTPSPSPSSKPSSNVGELAGGTAAECLVVCCCCPCVLLEFLFLAVYKVPSTIFRRFWRKRRQKITALKRRGLLRHATVNVSRSGSGHVVPGYYCDELSDVDLKEFEKVKVSIDGSDEAVELDKMMWDHFQNAGFGRSVSQRHS